jgi:hypothetical protein
MPRRIFGPKSDEVAGEWRKLHNEEFNDPYFLSNFIRAIKSIRMRRVVHAARKEKGRDRVLVGKPEGKRSLGKPRRRWEDNVKMDL